MLRATVPSTPISARRPARAVVRPLAFIAENKTKILGPKVAHSLEFVGIHAKDAARFHSMAHTFTQWERTDAEHNKAPGRIFQSWSFTDHGAFLTEGWEDAQSLERQLAATGNLLPRLASLAHNAYSTITCTDPADVARAKGAMKEHLPTTAMLETLSPVAGKTKSLLPGYLSMPELGPKVLVRLQLEDVKSAAEFERVAQLFCSIADEEPGVDFDMWSLSADEQQGQILCALESVQAYRVHLLNLADVMPQLHKVGSLKLAHYTVVGKQEADKLRDIVVDFPRDVVRIVTVDTKVSQ